MHYTHTWPIENPDVDLADLLDEATRDLRTHLAARAIVGTDSPRWTVTPDKITATVPVRDLTTREMARIGWHGRFRREAAIRASNRPADNVASDEAKEAQSFALRMRDISAENRERISECRRVHPDWTHEQIGLHLHLSSRTVTRHLSATEAAA